jgi:hypothetical protein
LSTDQIQYPNQCLITALSGVDRLLEPSKRSKVERELRRAEAQCQRGHYLEALMLIEPYPGHPLASAVRVRVMVARYELTRALEEGPGLLLSAKRAGHPEAMARIHQHLANAAWSLNRRELYREHLEQARNFTVQCADVELLAGIAASLVSNAEDDHELDLNDPQLGWHGSLEERFKILRILVQRGEYRLALNALDQVLAQRIGGAIEESLRIALGQRLVANLPRTFEHRPWLVALEGITHLEVNTVLSGGPVRPTVASNRGVMIWRLAMAWARLRRGELAQVASELTEVRVSPLELDLKLWRNLTVLALAVHDWALAQRVVSNVHGVLLETVALTQSFPAHMPLLKQMDRSLPEAYVLLHTFFESEPAFSHPPVLMIGGVGISVNGVLRSKASSLRQIALGLPMTPNKAQVAAAYRWRRLLRSLGNPVPVDAILILGVLRKLVLDDPKLAKKVTVFCGKNDF